MTSGYPVLKEDIFFAKIYNAEVKVRIRNTTTEKDFKADSATVALLNLCTGTRTIDEIIDNLSAQSGKPREEIDDSVNMLLHELMEKGLVAVPPRAEGTPRRAKNIQMRYPLEGAHIDITNACNLSCLHCINDSGECFPDEVTTEEICSLIDTVSALGVHSLTLSGGEPLVHPDLFDIVQHARKAPMTVTIFTNGTLVTESFIKEFKKLGVTKFNVSIDSVSANACDQFRGQEGALGKTLHAVTLMKKAGFSVKPYVSVSQMNKNDMIPLIQYFKEQNFTNFQMTPVRYSGRGVDTITITPEEYYNVLAELFAYCKKEFPEGIVNFCRKNGEKCIIASNKIAFKADGTILPCPGSIGDMGVGNIRNTGIEKVWESNETLEIIRDMKVENDEACRGCRYLDSCGGCIAGGFLEGRELQCHDPYVCAVYTAYDNVVGLPK